MFRNRLFLYLSLIGILIILFLCLPNQFGNSFKSFLNQSTVPVLNSSHGFFEKIGNIFEGLFQFSTIKSENQKLQMELAELRLKVDHLQNVTEENERLTQLLHFVEESPWKSLSARVVGRAPSQWNQSLWIDQGKINGVQEGMAVVSAEGVIGKIAETFPEWSRVMLLSDENCKVGAMIRESGELGILQGNASKGNYVLNYLPREAQAKPTDAIVTSGLSEFFPSGLTIGVVSKIYDDAYGLFQYAEVKPNANLGKLREVIVVLSKEKPIPEEGV